MLDFTNDVFLYNRLTENTRFVIFEKFDLKKELSYTKKEELNAQQRKEQIAQSLRELAMRLNTHVIITNQHSRVYKGGDDFIEHVVNDKSIVLMSDAYFTTTRLPEEILVNNNKSSTFLVCCNKNRYSPTQTRIKCILNPETLTFATIEE